MRQQTLPAAMSSMEGFSTGISVEKFPERTFLYLMFFPVVFCFVLFALNYVSLSFWKHLLKNYCNGF